METGNFYIDKNMKQTTIDAIQQAKDKNLIVPFVLASEEDTKPSTKTNGQIIAIWASRYDKQLSDALLDLYQPLELLFREIDGKCEGSFLFVNTATKSIFCLYLGRYNRLQVLQLNKKVSPVERGSSQWKQFTKIDVNNDLNAFAGVLEDFGRHAHASNQLPIGADSESLDCLGNKALQEINRVIPNIGWGDLNNQDA